MVNLGYLPKKLYSVHVTIDGNKLKYSTKVSNREVSPVHMDGCKKKKKQKTHRDPQASMDAMD